MTSQPSNQVSSHQFDWPGKSSGFPHRKQPSTGVRISWDVDPSSQSHLFPPPKNDQIVHNTFTQRTLKKHRQNQMFQSLQLKHFVFEWQQSVTEKILPCITLKEKIPLFASTKRAHFRKRPHADPHSPPNSKDLIFEPNLYRDSSFNLRKHQLPHGCFMVFHVYIHPRKLTHPLKSDCFNGKIHLPIIDVHGTC